MIFFVAHICLNFIALKFQVSKIPTLQGITFRSEYTSRFATFFQISLKQIKFWLIPIMILRSLT